MNDHDAMVHIVDDDEAVCRALCRLVRSVGMEAQSYASAQAFLDGYTNAHFGCLVLDVRMPGLSGLDLQQALAARNIRIPIVFVTGHADIPMSVRAMKGGAVDFIEKPFNDQSLLDAINRALERDADYRNAQVATAAIRARVDRLTPRERQVLALVVAGKPNKQIAADLGASEKTIKVHRARVMQKLEATSVPDLVRISQAAGINPPENHD